MAIAQRLFTHQKIIRLLLEMIFIITALSIWQSSPSESAQYMQVIGLVDVRTTFSDGTYSIDQVARLARERGFGALFVTDHDRMALSYGLPPFRNLVKRSEEKNSVNILGADQYLGTIAEVQKQYPDLVIIPGSETAVFYYWTGNPFSGNLTAHNHEKRLLTIGMNKPENYQEMPILHNHYALNYQNLDRAALLFLGAALLSLLLLFWKGSLRIMGIICFPIAVLLLVNSNPLKTSPFDAYSGDQGIAPYQLVIDYVNNQGGMTFWNYPETHSGVRKLGPIQVSTKPYPRALLESKGYTGFSAVYGDNTTITEPGNIWDITLAEYCRGYRLWPPWAIATADYHGEGQDGARLGDYPTVFLVPEKTREAILKAMQTGKMYACRAHYPLIPRLDEFSVSSADGQKTAIAGEEIALRGHPKICIALSISGSGPPRQVKARLIRSGKVVSAFEGRLPLKIEYEDPYFQPGEKTYYRMDMRGDAGMIVSNPIFVTFER